MNPPPTNCYLRSENKELWLQTTVLSEIYVFKSNKHVTGQQWIRINLLTLERNYTFEFLCTAQVNM